jgi:hypothetical protein
VVVALRVLAGLAGAVRPLAGAFLPLVAVLPLPFAAAAVGRFAVPALPLPLAGEDFCAVDLAGADVLAELLPLPLGVAGGLALALRGSGRGRGLALLTLCAVRGGCGLALGRRGAAALPMASMCVRRSSSGIVL